MTQNPRRIFRTTDTAAFTKFVTDHNLAVPASIINVIDPPTYEALETMIDGSKRHIPARAARHRRRRSGRRAAPRDTDLA